MADHPAPLHPSAAAIAGPVANVEPATTGPARPAPGRHPREPAHSRDPDERHGRPGDGLPAVQQRPQAQTDHPRRAHDQRRWLPGQDRNGLRDRRRFRRPVARPAPADQPARRARHPGPARRRRLRADAGHRDPEKRLPGDPRLLRRTPQGHDAAATGPRRARLALRPRHQGPHPGRHHPAADAPRGRPGHPRSDPRVDEHAPDPGPGRRRHPRLRAAARRPPGPGHRPGRLRPTPPCPHVHRRSGHPDRTPLRPDRPRPVPLRHPADHLSLGHPPGRHRGQPATAARRARHAHRRSHAGIPVPPHRRHRRPPRTTHRRRRRTRHRHRRRTVDYQAARHHRRQPRQPGPPRHHRRRDPRHPPRPAPSASKGKRRNTVFDDHGGTSGDQPTASTA